MAIKGEKIKRICPVCKSEHEVWPCHIARGTGIYCSRSCYNIGRVKKQSVTCLACGKPFDLEPSKIAGGQVYCSVPCRYKHQYQKIALICLTCGDSFKVQPSEVKHNRQYCSWACYTKRPMPTGSVAPNWQGGPITKPCKLCGQFFTTWDRGQKYCKKECYSKAKSIYAVRENAPRWIDGRSFLPYPTTFNPSFKRMIRERDGYRCARCGAPNSRDIHHVDTVKANTVPENCITLCKSCHGKCQGNRDHWLRLYREILILRDWGAQ